MPNTINRGDFITTPTVAVGGFVAPAITGAIAHHSRLLAAPIIAGGCALVAGLLCLRLEETAPAKLRTCPAGLPALAGSLSG